MPNVLAFAEARGGELRKVAFEAVTAARQVADQVGGDGTEHRVRHDDGLAAGRRGRRVVAAGNKSERRPGDGQRSEHTATTTTRN